MGDLRRRLLAVLTFIPSACIAIFLFIVIAATIAGGGDPDDHLIVGEPVLALAVSALLLSAALTRVYVPHAKENVALKEHQTKRWVFALELYGPFSMPIYWWRHVRAERRLNSPPS